MDPNEFPKDEIKKSFYENYNSLSEEDIIEINRNHQGGDINNVIVGLCRECFGVLLINDNEETTYQLFYINGQNKLEGDLIHLSLGLEYREDLTFYFSSFLANNYEDLDPIDVFNTFQNQVRSMLERIGYITVDNITFGKFNNPTFITMGSRGVIPINFIDRILVYRALFEKNQSGVEVKGNCDYVYLMLNKRNNYIKIGKSKNPLFREKTLQSDEPDIELVVAWMAAPIVEKELHKIFHEKKKRGEWFALKLSDMKIIREYMKDYN